MVFDVVVFTLSLTGLVMVVGGIILIARGAVALEAAKDGATALTLGDFLKLSTTVPGLGLFLIGLAFEVSAAIYANAARKDVIKDEIAKAVDADRAQHALHLHGYFEARDPGAQAITISVCVNGATTVFPNVPFDQSIDLYSESIILKAESPGVRTQIWALSKQVKGQYGNEIVLADGRADLGKVPLIQTVRLEELKPVASEAIEQKAAGGAYGASP